MTLEQRGNSQPNLQEETNIPNENVTRAMRLVWFSSNVAALGIGASYLTDNVPRLIQSITEGVSHNPDSDLTKLVATAALYFFGVGVNGIADERAAKTKALRTGNINHSVQEETIRPFSPFE